MNIDRLFALLEHKNGDKSLSEEDNAIIELYEKPLFWVGMFEKLIQNNNIFKQQLETVFRQDKHFNPQLLSDASDLIIYNRAYSFIELLNLEDEDHRNAVRTRAKYSYLINNLITSMNFFIGREEYENCAVLKKVLNFAQESLEM